MTILSLLEVIMKKYVLLLLILGGYSQGMHYFYPQGAKPQPTPEFYDARAAFGDDSMDSDEENAPYISQYDPERYHDTTKPVPTVKFYRERDAAEARYRARAGRDRDLAPRQIQFDSDSE